MKKCFEQRRKTLKNSLKNFFSENEFEMLEINHGSRPDLLSISDFKNLAKIFKGTWSLNGDKISTLMHNK